MCTHISNIIILNRTDLAHARFELRSRPKKIVYKNGVNNFDRTDSMRLICLLYHIFTVVCNN